MAEADLDSFLKACSFHAGGEPNENLRRLTGEFLRRAAEDTSILSAAAASLEDLPAAGASWLAVAIGAAIEQGEGVELTSPAILNLFLSWLPKLPKSDITPDEESGPSEHTPDQVALLPAFALLCQSLVSHLARMPELRAKLAQDTPLLDRLDQLEEHSHGAAWVREMLLRSSGSLLVLHPPSETGLRMRYENVATCFHLFSLVQTAIGRRIPGGRSPDATIAAAARGQTDQVVHDEAWWHYGDPRSATANLGASIWGEALVPTIPFVDGVQVMLLWPPILASRGWDSSFFGPHLSALPPDAIVEHELADDDCRVWFEVLGIARDKRRKWWFW